MCFAPTTILQNTAMITQSLSLLQQATGLLTKFSNMHKKHMRQASDPLWGTVSATTTATKKTTKMPQQYCPNLKGKEWVHVEDVEADTEEVDEVWEMQKKALSDSTILGRHIQSGCRWAIVCLPSLASSSSIKAPATSPSSFPTIRDKTSLPSIFQYT